MWLKYAEGLWLTQGKPEWRSQVMTPNEIGTTIVACAIALHRETGPGLLETVY